MTDILNIGLSALLAQQRALTTTANNISNASTPGYSRQRVELTERPTERFGPYSLGTGVDVSMTRRMSDEILAEQVRSAAGGFHRADAFVALAESLDDLLAGTETGLTATMQSCANALQDVANDPSSSASRQALLSVRHAIRAAHSRSRPSMSRRVFVTTRISAAFTRWFLQSSW